MPVAVLVRGGPERLVFAARLGRCPGMLMHNWRVAEEHHARSRRTAESILWPGAGGAGGVLAEATFADVYNAVLGSTRTPYALEWDIGGL